LETGQYLLRVYVFLFPNRVDTGTSVTERIIYHRCRVKIGLHTRSGVWCGLVESILPGRQYGYEH